jgi:hypothetical protein
VGSYSLIILSSIKNFTLLPLFTNINFFSLEQRQELNRIIAVKFNKNKSKLIDLLNYLDEKDNRYNSFSIMNKIQSFLKIQIHEP